MTQKKTATKKKPPAQPAKRASPPAAAPCACLADIVVRKHSWQQQRYSQKCRVCKTKMKIVPGARGGANTLYQKAGRNDWTPQRPKCVASAPTSARKKVRRVPTIDRHAPPPVPPPPVSDTPAPATVSGTASATIPDLADSLIPGEQILQRAYCDDGGYIQ